MTPIASIVLLCFVVGTGFCGERALVRYTYSDPTTEASFATPLRGQFLLDGDTLITRTKAQKMSERLSLPVNVHLNCFKNDEKVGDLIENWITLTQGTALQYRLYLRASKDQKFDDAIPLMTVKNDAGGVSLLVNGTKDFNLGGKAFGTFDAAASQISGNERHPSLKIVKLVFRKSVINEHPDLLLKIIQVMNSKSPKVLYSFEIAQETGKRSQARTRSSSIK